MQGRSLRLGRLWPVLLILNACGSDQGPDVVADVTVTPASTSLVVGDSVQLTATARSSDGRVLSLANRTTTWTTTNPEVATVSGSGMVLALSLGRVVIRATIEDHGGEADVTVTETVPPPGGIRIVSGDGQQTTVTDTMPDPLVVQVLDQNDAPRPGVVATFLTASDTADLTANFVTTDANGLASTVVVLKTKAGPFTVSVTAAGQSGSAEFNLRALADVAVSSSLVGGDGQNGFVSRPLPAPLVVELTDQYANQASGRDVEWVVTGGGGAPSSAITSTDDSGRASVTWTMGVTPGPNTIEAHVAGLPAISFSALAVPPGPGRITFTRGEGPPGSLLMRMNPDSSGLAPLPGSVPGDFGADWSHDGSRLVFANFAANSSRISGFNDFADIVVMNADGTGHTRLTDHFGSVTGPVWSPNGTKIAFASDQTGQSEVYVMNTDGSNIVQLTNTGGLAPSWSPDGTRIAVGVTIVPSTNQTAFVINASDGGNRVSLVPGADPAWSPDGSLIALARCTDPGICDPDDPILALIHPDGTGLTPLPTPHGVYQPAWAPDGSKLGARYLPTRDAGSGGGSFIITVNPDGTGAIVLSGPADHLPSWGP